jgi:hypothetical protein
VAVISFRRELAPRIAPVVLANITTHYPFHEPVLFRAGDEPADPITAHPAFGNSFDWHSSVHSHWTALQLLAFSAGRGDAPHITAPLREAVVHNLSDANIRAETAFLASRPAYERPYGWGWAMVLAAAAATSPLEGVRLLGTPLKLLAENIAASATTWLTVLPAPVRHGIHGNSAFALGLMHDAAATLQFRELTRVIERRAKDWFGNDRDYPDEWERSGNDFLSPGLAEAELLRRIAPRHEFRVWWHAFLGGAIANSKIVAPVEVPTVSDGQIVHLHGLNLSRAGMLVRIAVQLGEPESKPLLEAARRLYRASASEAFGSEYLSTHWLPTFAWDAASSLDAYVAAGL